MPETCARRARVLHEERFSCEPAIESSAPGRVNLIGDHVDYAVKRIGIDHVGISSDFDGGGWFSDWKNAADSANITAELVKRGYDRGALEKLWGGNFLRVMRVVEQAAG